MYDVLRSRYTFACPTRGETHVALSAFRRLVRLPGAAHPAVYRDPVRRAAAATTHVGLVADDDLDWAPLGLTAGTFLNLMTSTYRLDRRRARGRVRRSASRRASGRGASSATRRSARGRCSRRRSRCSLPAERAFGVAVRCPVCSRVSVNLVSPEHIDLPFHNDAHVGVVEHVFHADVAADARGVPRGALFVGVRLPPARAGVTAAAAGTFSHYRNQTGGEAHAHLETTARRTQVKHLCRRASGRGTAAPRGPWSRCSESALPGSSPG